MLSVYTALGSTNRLSRSGDSLEGVKKFASFFLSKKFILKSIKIQSTHFKTALIEGCKVIHGIIECVAFSFLMVKH